MKLKFSLLVLITIIFLSGNTYPQDLKGNNYLGRSLNFSAHKTQTVTNQAKDFQKTTDGSIIYVPTDYPIIQDAIDASADGDTVIIEEGTYDQQFRYNGKAIAVGSRYLLDNDTTHISKTIIDGSTYATTLDYATIVLIIDEEVTSLLCGLTLQNGHGSYIEADDEKQRLAGAIAIQSAGAIIKDNIIKNCKLDSDTTWNFGGAILCHYIPEGKTVEITGNLISGNEVSGGEFGFGGGIRIDNLAGSLHISNNKIINNTCLATKRTFGGGIDIYYCDSEDIVFSNNLIKGNTIGGGNEMNRGGGIHACNLKLDIWNNLIMENNFTTGYAIKGGGIYVANYLDDPQAPVTKASIVNNTILNNTTENVGGGIFSQSIVTEVKNNIIRGNEASYGAQIHHFTILPVVSYSDIEGGYTGTGNIDVDPKFCDTSYCLLTINESPCIDAGDPDAQYTDVPDPGNPFQALYPALGGTRNDMGAYGGPNSEWDHWPFPLPVELTTFTAQLNGSKVSLNWKTATELNNHGFEIQRNVNNSGWNVIGFIKGAGTTTEEQNYSYVDDIEYLSNGTLSYRLKQLDFGGTFEYSKIVEISNFAISYELSQNYPNPFNPSTIIKYQLAGKERVQLKIYDVLGTEITTLVNEEKEPGSYKVELNAANLPSGVYFYKLQAGEFTATKKMLLLK